MERRKSILDMGPKTARKFLLENESYCTTKLPEYINFENVLKYCMDSIEKSQNGLNDFIETNNIECSDEINYHFYIVKDTKYSWRKITLINPYFYCDLVNFLTKNENWLKIKDRLNYLRKNSDVECYSIPNKSKSKNDNLGENISEWSYGIEKGAIKKSLKFKYVLVTDIANFYPSIYTHSLSWAMHDKEIVKQNINEYRGPNSKHLGAQIDFRLQRMNDNQTNGIFLGSVLMDFIAEILLAYGDYEITKKLKEMRDINKIGEYNIIRYRDDYHIFSNNYGDLEEILKVVNQCLLELTLTLNSKKTKIADNVISASLKEYKKEWLALKKRFRGTIRDELLLLLNFTNKFPNAGCVPQELKKIAESIKEKQKYDFKELIAILTELAKVNNKYVHYCFSIISLIMENEKIEYCEKQDIYKNISKKIKNEISNIEYSFLWLQRITSDNLLISKDDNYVDTFNLCKLIRDSVNNNGKYNVEGIFNFNFLKNVKSNEVPKIIDFNKLDKIGSEISINDIEIFNY